MASSLDSWSDSLLFCFLLWSWATDRCACTCCKSPANPILSVVAKSWGNRHCWQSCSGQLVSCEAPLNHTLHVKPTGCVGKWKKNSSSSAKKCNFSRFLGRNSPQCFSGRSFTLDTCPYCCSSVPGERATLGTDALDLILMLAVRLAPKETDISPENNSLQHLSTFPWLLVKLQF